MQNLNIVLLCICEISGQSVQEAQGWQNIISGTQQALKLKNRTLTEARFVNYGNELKTIEELGSNFGLVIVCGGIGFLYQHKAGQMIANFLERKTEINQEALQFVEKANVPQKMMEKSCLFPKNSAVLICEGEPLCGFFAGNFICVPHCKNFTKMLEVGINFFAGAHATHYERITIDKISPEIESFLEELHFEKGINIEMVLNEGKFVIELSGTEQNRVEYVAKTIEDLNISNARKP